MYNYHCYNDFLYFKINKEKLERTIKIFNKRKEKIENIKEKEKEKVKKEKASKPTIDKNSETIFKEVVKSSAPVHLRLFNKKYQTAKTSMLQEKEKEKKLKEEAQKYKGI